ncbi:MAG: hypothetical protein A2840_01120 [Candidatus Buchananbacteria bacterium RIFCSPHIGHO2_01_FULL_47_11b]|uniref:Probable queuosine precursor transporter n=1 Tax=Candidatus Buchananbacteria bacterium RIFCSPHIGHO2_01_FULL_47_11b TaxID=1797537 RepID=A0A1G1Y632_9BACT|nr:MAG: hypothetical protein A2840_01120 [Candidatus Buchananbacteria bacterium RIFCSPHIGHO2_01_FULL_47_11b]
MKFSTQQQKLQLLLGLYIASLLAANFLGAKITAFSLPYFLATGLNLLFWPVIFILNLITAVLPDYTIFSTPFLHYDFFNIVHVSVGILTVPVMFLITDVVEEVCGRKKASEFVNVAVATMLFALVITLVSVWLPADPARQYFSSEAYTSIFGISARIIIASIVAFVLAQYHDLWAFDFWRKKTAGRYLWLRNNASTIVSQFIDSTVFMFIAFYHISPAFNAIFIFSLILPYWIFKILFALLDTPFAYALVAWLKKNPDQPT